MEASLIRNLLLQQCALLIVAMLMACSSTPAIMIVGVVALGILYARNLEFMHAALHGGLLRGGRANRIAGALLGAPMLVSFDLWRREHAQHHRDVREEGFVYEYQRLNNLWQLIIHMLMLRHLRRCILSLTIFGKHLLRQTKHGTRPGSLSLANGGATLGMLTVLTVATFVLRHPYIVTLWLLPLPIACIAHTLIELPEHLGMNMASPDPFQNSRILRASRFTTWLVLYNNYHAMHHASPALPIPSLPSAYERSHGEQPVPHQTYWTFFTRQFPKIIA